MPNEARLMACQAKSHLSDVTKDVAKKSTEVHGGMGFTDLLGLHYWFKRIGNSSCCKIFASWTSCYFD